MKHFHLREIWRLVDLALPSIKNHVSELEKEGLLKKEKSGLYITYVSNRSEKFKLYKKLDVIIRIYESGLLETLEEKFLPKAIVLFGSASRGEDTERSDIDLFILANEKPVNLIKFEEKLKRKISIHAEKSIKDVPKELLNNILNGSILYGYLKVFS